MLSYPGVILGLVMVGAASGQASEAAPPIDVPIQIVDRSAMIAYLAGSWWERDDHEPILVPRGSPPIPVPGSDGLIAVADLQRFRDTSKVNPDRAVMRLLGPPDRRRAVLGQTVLLWTHPVVVGASGQQLGVRMVVEPKTDGGVIISLEFLQPERLL